MDRILFLLSTALLTGLAFAQTPTPAPDQTSLPPLIDLVGPPLSGKTSVAASVSDNYKIPVISIEDLISAHADELNQLRGEGVSLAEMRYDPSMSRFLRDRLKTTDLTHGLILDGFPATLVQAQDLRDIFQGQKMKFIAMRLTLPDDEIRKRAKTTGRESDNPQILEQRIKDYHREMDWIGSYFPNAKIVDVDANRPEPEVYKSVQTILAEEGLKPSGK